MSLRDEKTRITNEKITPPSLIISIVRMRAAVSLSHFRAAIIPISVPIGAPVGGEEVRTDR